MIEANDQYLWDRSGAIDREIEELETVLAPFRCQTPEPVWILQQPLHATGWQRWRAMAALAFATVALAAVALLLAGRFAWRDGQPWKVSVLEGSPQISGAALSQRGEMAVGETLTTSPGSQARIRVANLGVVDVAPDSRVQLLATSAKRHRLALTYGTISAHMWAPPFSLAVDTPSAALFDLGCAFTLHVDRSGSGRVNVTSGWVQFQAATRSVIIPAGAEAATRPGAGPGTPYFSDATPAFQAAVVSFDRDAGATALNDILENARPRDAFTLLSLISQLPPEQRGAVVDRLALLAPIPASYTREDVVNLREDALDAYWSTLNLGSPKSWLVHWKDVLGY